MPNLNSSQDLRLLLPETVWLEPEHFLLAQQTSSLEKTDHNISWQVYLNTLALLGFEIWLQKRLRGKVITRDVSTVKTGGNLKIDEFKFCAIATESLLSEVIRIPSLVIENPVNSAHFYVVVEVLEEQEEVVIRGFLSHNELVEIINDLKLSIHEGCYQIPLYLFDMEPNHLSLYQSYLETSEFAPPQVNSQMTKISENLSNLVSKTTTNLSKWLQGIVDEGWQTVDYFYKPELNLAFNTRNIDPNTKRTKIIDLGLNLNSHKVALLIGISSEGEDNDNTEKISVIAQLRPMSGEIFLPHNIKLFLISKAGKILQEVTSRIQDNCIQLNSFKGEPGKKFSIKVSLGDCSITEKFEL
ncbi:MAG: DUF1822 family protein [Cyanobacteria bacterium P01_D01_bin.116]